jgi:hypothetical protein
MTNRPLAHAKYVHAAIILIAIQRLKVQASRKSSSLLAAFMLPPAAVFRKKRVKSALRRCAALKNVS